jgi:hypothetical protein
VYVSLVLTTTPYGMNGIIYSRFRFINTIEL